MNTQLLRGVAIFVALLLVQILVFNHIHLFNCATPLLYIYVVLLFPRNIPRWLALLSGFIMGFFIINAWHRKYALAVEIQRGNTAAGIFVFGIFVGLSLVISGAVH